MVKNLPANAGDIRGVGLIPGSGSSPGGGHGNPPQNSCLESLTDRGAWWAIVQMVTKSWTCLKRLSRHACTDCSSPCFPVLHYLPEFAQTHVQLVGYACNHLILCCPLLILSSIFPASKYFPMSWLFTSGGQSIGASASASVLPMKNSKAFDLTSS